MKVLFILLILLVPLQAHGAKYGIKTYIPSNFYHHADTVKEEVDKFSPGFTAGYMAGHIEQESCISLRHSRCWKSTARLKTKREEGIGLGQLTRTWRRNGSIRFDTLTKLTKTYRTHLKGLSWRTVRNRPDLQIRAMVFLLMENWNKLPRSLSNADRLPFIASGYNQGMGGIKRDRRLCGLKKGCNPNKWFGNVEKVKRWGFSTRILYGRRTAWDINRHHVSNIIYKRMLKYETYYKTHP